MKKIRVIEAVNQLGLGGTEYALQLYCKYLNKDIFHVTVVSLLKGGERVKLIQKQGTEVVVLDGDFTGLPSLLKNTDVFHWHGSGACSLDPELFSALKANKPKLVIQTNVFGAFDNSQFYGLIDYDLYISKMILIRRMQQDRKLKDDFSHKRKVLPYPVETDHINNLLPTDLQITEFKEKNNLSHYFLAGRIGRADNNKFDLITLDGFAEFAKKVDNTRFLLVGATLEMELYAKQIGIADKLLIFENTIDLHKLLIYYKTMDVFIAASNIGESFGMVIAEAMTAGTPVITISTEDRDNAQIELIDNNKSGLVVKRNKRSIARALHFLYKNKPVANKLSEQAKLRISQEYKAQKIVQSLENLILNHFDLPAQDIKEKSLLQNYSPEMVSDYLNRCVNLFGRTTIQKKLIRLLRKKAGSFS